MAQWTPEEIAHEKEHDRLVALLRPQLTDAVLAVMVCAVRTSGDLLDSVASEDFVRWCFGVAGKACPDLTPFH
jgi:hypothetical protein